MNLHESYFRDYLQSDPSPLQDPYGVVVHVAGIVSTSAVGVELKVRDHTGTAVFALRGEAAGHFYKEHIRRPEHPDPITDSFALNGTWFATYLFRINSTRPVAIKGEDCFIVPQICMHKETIDQFCLYIMEEEAYQSYKDAIAIEIPVGPGYRNSGMDISLNRPGCVGLRVGSRKHIYVPYMP